MPSAYSELREGDTMQRPVDYHIVPVDRIAPPSPGDLYRDGKRPCGGEGQRRGSETGGTLQHHLCGTSRTAQPAAVAPPQETGKASPP